jgi:hypothetical protein
MTEIVPPTGGDFVATIRQFFTQQMVEIAKLQANQEELTNVIHELRDEVKKGRSVSTGDIKMIKRPFRSETPFDGIISYLQAFYPENWRDYVTASASSVLSNRIAACGPMKALVFNEKFYFHTQEQKNPWLCLDFKAMRVSITWYSLRTRHECLEDGPVNWKLLGSMDEHTWEILDERSGISALNALNASSSYDTKTKFECRYVRFEQSGLNSSGRRYLVLSAFEIFGTLTMQL